jgi:DNA-binding NarL/FixJ family response regulator
MRVLLADHESNVRYGLRALLEEQPDLHIAGEAADAEELLAQTEAACPDLLVLSWGLPGLPGAELLADLRRVKDDLYVIVLSGRPELRQVVLEAGADVFVSKVEPPERLLAAIAAAEHDEKKETRE